jgi:hypothetical protein
MLADRVSVVEGILDDLAHGHIPNTFGERGWKAEWKHNRNHFLTRFLVRTAIASVAVAYLSSRRKPW